MDVPSGFKFADAENAQKFLNTAKTSRTSGRLLGIVMHDSGWYLTLEYFDTGHVKDSVPAQFNQEAILSSLQPRRNELNKARESRQQPPIANFSWETKPVYHEDSHIVEWALKGEGFTPGDAVLDYNFRLLSRRGVLQGRATLFRAVNSGSDQIRDLVSAISLKGGEKYADFQSGEKTAALASSSLVTADLSPSSGEVASAVDGNWGMKAFWIVVAAVGCLGLVGGGILAKRFRRDRAPIPAQAESVGLTQAPAIKNGGLKLNGAKQFGFNGRPKLARNGVNGNGNGSSNHGHGKRRRTFNYHKFYTEMVLQGPAPQIGENYNGYDVETLRYNNGRNGKLNGDHGNGNGNAAQANGSAMISAHGELLATQRGLIEEQKRLIQEQARLIEEKSKLIAEKNQLLDKQSQMIENNLL